MRTPKGRPESVAPSLVYAVIPGLPPSVNHTYSYGRRTVYKDASAKQWQKMASLYLRRGRSGDAPYAGRVSCNIILTTKTKRRMDCDNRIKAVQDCLAVAGVLLDDSQIWALNVTRREGSEETTTVEVIAIVDPDTSDDDIDDRRGHADGDTGAGKGTSGNGRRNRDGLQQGHCAKNANVHDDREHRRRTQRRRSDTKRTRAGGYGVPSDHGRAHVEAAPFRLSPIPEGNEAV